MSRIIVHHLADSRSQRVLWLLEELEMPYEVIRYERDPKTMLAPPELRKVHPLGKSPVIGDRDASGIEQIIAETGAIIEYLTTKAGGPLGRPDTIDAALRYTHFLHYAEGSLMPPLLVGLVLSRIPIMGKIAQRRLQPMIDVHLDFVEGELSSRPWFAGDTFTAADVMMSFPLEAARERADLEKGRPKTIAWLERIHARPAYKAALAKGGPYRFA